MPKADDELVITIVYRGENGELWMPPTRRALWDYGVRTGQIVLPAEDDGGDPSIEISAGDEQVLEWVPPQYAGRLRKAAAPAPVATYFELEENPDA